jgi:hypothetical protein
MPNILVMATESSSRTLEIPIIVVSSAESSEKPEAYDEGACVMI